LHIHDNDYKGDQHQLPYMGRIDWNKVTEALGEIDYDGDFTYEIGTFNRLNRVGEELAPVELKYMADIGKYLVSKIEANRKK
jgi:sugar phosphate isomerase/epimerase